MAVNNSYELVDVDDYNINQLDISKFNIDNRPGHYLNEIYIQNYITNVFKSLSTVLGASQALVDTAKSYIDNVVNISDSIVQPEVIVNDFSKTGLDINLTTGITGMLKTNSTATIIAGSLNLRTGAGTENDVICTLSNGTKLKVIDNSLNNGWMEVETEDGTRGFVSSKSKYVDINNSK